MKKAVREIAKELVDLYEQRSLRFDERRDFIHEAKREEIENGE